MVNIIENNMDFIVFIYGLNCILLAAISLAISQQNIAKFPWKYLGLFGAFHGLGEWLEVFTKEFGESKFTEFSDTTLLIISFIFLYEFGRKSLKQTHNIKIHKLFYIPLLALTCLGLFAGLDGINACSRYVFGSLGTILTFISLISYAKTKKNERTPLFALATSILIYAIFELIDVHNTGFFPGNIINESLFKHFSNLPIELFKALCTIIIAYSFSEYYIRINNFSEKTKKSYFTKRHLNIKITIIVALCAACTYIVGEYGSRLDENTNIYSKLHHAERELEERINASKNTVASIANNNSFKNSIGNQTSQNISIINSIIDNHSKIMPNTIIYFMNPQGVTLYSSNRHEADSFIGKSFAIRPYFKDALENKIGSYFALGLTSKVPGYYSSKAIIHNGKIIGVLAVKTAIADGIFVSVSSTQLVTGFIVSPEGFVLYSTNPKYQLQSMWPIEASIAKNIIASGQVPKITTPAILPQSFAFPMSIHFENKKAEFWRLITKQEKWSVVVAAHYSLHSIFRMGTILLTIIFMAILLTIAYIKLKNKKITDVIIKAEEQYRCIFEKNNSIMFTVNPNTGKFLDANNAACKFYGYSHADFCEKYIFDIKIATQKAIITQKDLIIDNNSLEQYEAQHKLSNGKVVDVEVHASKLIINDETVIFAIVYDVSVRKQIEQDLLLDDALVRSILSLMQHEQENTEELLHKTLHNITLLLQSNLGYIYFYDDKSKEFTLQAWHKTENQCCKKEPQQIYALQNSGLLKETITKKSPVIINNCATPEYVENEYLREHAQINNILSVPIFSNGEIVAVAILANKENDYREKDIKQLNLTMDSLWRILAKNNAELDKTKMQSQLLHSEKLASIGILAAGVAHEINNPLAIISGNISVIEKRIPPDTLAIVNPSLEKMQKSVQRISDIVNHLRIYARTDTEVIETINIHEILSDLLVMIQSIYNKNGVLIESNFTSKHPIIKANTGKLQQVFMNLISNAKDALEGVSEDAKIKITTQDSENNITITITDNGSGIAPENLATIFDAFFTTKAPGKGTGLGLSISYSIINSFAGSIQVESIFGMGTSFTVTLPLCNEQYIEKTENDTNHDFTTTGTALIVDDEADIRDILYDFLTDFGLQVTLANNGLDALSILQNHTFDFLVTDIQMPQMNGILLISEAKKIPHFIATKILVVTGGVFADLNINNTNKDLNIADGYLRKPFDRDSIRNSFELLLKKN